MMNKTVFILVSVFISSFFMQHSKAQVTIGAGEVPDKDALLDLKENSVGESTKGLLLPRVSLLSIAQSAPMSSHVVGMVVYNISTVGDVSPGYYYNDGTKWVRLVGTDVVSSSWIVDGNMNGMVKAIGNKDAYDLPVIVNGVEAIRAVWDEANSTTRLLVGTTDSEVVASATSGSPSQFQLAKFTLDGGDVSFNGITLGMGGAQVPSNTIIGRYAFYNNLNGSNSLAIGYESLYNNRYGSTNHAIGAGALYANTTGGNNLAIGYNAVRSNTIGSGNTGVGTEALNNTTGSYNVALGLQTAKSLSAGDNNIAIGYGQELANNTGSNQLNIGGAIFGVGLTGSASVPAGNIGIGTAEPNSSAILELKATDKGFLPPRVALASSTDVVTIASPATGLLVYNTGAAGLTATGYYFWDGSAWVRLASGATPTSVTRNVTIVTGNRTTTASAYEVQPTDYYIFIRLTGSMSGTTIISGAPYLSPNYNIKLPDPTLHVGREIYLINDSQALGTGLHAYTNYPIFGKGLQTTGMYDTPNITLASYLGSYCLSYLYSKIKIVSDGTRWISVNIDVV